MTAPEIEDVLALSPLQSGLHALAALTDGVDVYTMQFVIRLDRADPTRLRAAAQALLDRHPNLRVSIWDEDLPQPVQIVPDHADLPWREAVVSGAELGALCSADAAEPFDLSHGPLLRATHVTVPGDGARLIFTAHHILLDGWSMAVFFRELLAVYDGVVLAPPPLFRDHIAWLAAQDHEAGLRTFEHHLDGARPTTIAATPVSPGTVPGAVTCKLDAAATARVLGWARGAGLTPAAVTATAWAVVLGRLTDRDDVVFGATVAGRPATLPGVESMVGLFINTVPQRVTLEPRATVAGACAAVQADAARMREVAHLPLVDITRRAGGPLFDTLFVFENAPIGDATAAVTTADGASFTPVAMQSLAHYPLSVVALIDPAGGASQLTVVIEAVDGLDAVGDPRELGERLLQVLAAMPTTATVAELPTGRPGDLPAPPAAPADEFVPLPRLLADLVRDHPRAKALRTATAELTYQQLGAEVALTAAALRTGGVRRGDRVGLLAERDERAVIAILAALHIGAAYLPLAPDLPDERIAVMLTRARAAAVLTTAAHSARAARLGKVILLDGDPGPAEPATHPAPVGLGEPVDLRPDDPAYVIFTSGSTGEPKGVLGTHGALAAYRADHVRRMYLPAVARLGRTLRVAHGWSLSFDASWQPLLALFSGHALRLLSEEEIRDAQTMIAVLAQERIDMIDTSPSLFGQLAAAGLVGDGGTDSTADGSGGTADGSGGGLSVLALGGEAIPPHLWDRLAALGHTDVHNCYGPTETTVEAVIAQVTGGGPRIGEPTAGTRAYVLDRRLRPAPRGTVGELYLGGSQLTRGYIGRRDLTAGRFVADPFTGAGDRMYRTGDLVRLDPRGRLVFLGRADDQVKVRGYRIELGEVESAIASAPGITGAAVAVLRRDGSATLIGFARGDADPVAVRGHVARTLPAYMVPARIEVCARLPLTRNGKVDGAALTARAEALLAAQPAGAPPRTRTERKVAAVCEALWPGAGTDVNADFFERGLDSILAIAAVGRLRRAGVEVNPRMLLANPTIATLAAAVDAVPAGGGDNDAHRNGSGAAPAPVIAPVDVTDLPAVHRTLAGGGYARYAQAGLFAVPSGSTAAEITAVLGAVLAAHPVFGARITGGRMLVDRAAPTATEIFTELGDQLATVTDTVASVDADSGPLLAAGRVRRAGADTDLLVLAVHHLLADGVSWQILCEDLAEAAAGTAPLPEITTAAQYAAGLSTPAPRCVDARLDPGLDVASELATIEFALTPEESVTVAERGAESALVAALRRAVGAAPSGSGAAGGALAVTRHGRDDTRRGTDTSRTVGWFTEHRPAADCDADRDPRPELEARWVALNYLGRRDLVPGGPWRPVLDPELTALLPADPEPLLPVLFPAELLAVFVPGAGGARLTGRLRYLPRLIPPAEAADLARRIEAELITKTATVRN